MGYFQTALLGGFLFPKALFAMTDVSLSLPSLNVFRRHGKGTGEKARQKPRREC